MACGTADDDAGGQGDECEVDVHGQPVGNP